MEANNSIWMVILKEKKMNVASIQTQFFDITPIRGNGKDVNEGKFRGK